MSHLSGLHARALGLTALGVLGLVAYLAICFSGSSALHTPSASASGLTCAKPVDVSMLFDRSGSMGSPASKLTNAKAAAISFVDAFAGGPFDTDLSPHHMSAVSFSTLATTDQARTTNATAMRNAINAYTANGSTNLGSGLWLAEDQLEKPVDPDNDPDLNDYMVLLSDGSANLPMDIDNTGAENDIYLDVNGNGHVDANDDLSVTYPGGSSPDFVVVDGLLQINGGSQSARNASRLKAFDVNHSGTLTGSDDYNFGPGINFRIIDGALYLDMNGDGNFSVDTSTPNTSSDFTPGMTDELAVMRDGSMENGTNFAGDGVDVYAEYWATQIKKGGTFLYVVGYDLGDDDAALLSAIASPGGYFPGNLSNISSIFDSIGQSICSIALTKTRTSPALAPIGSTVTYTVNVSNNGDADLQNVDVHDTFDPAKLAFVSADLAPTTVGSGTLDWDNVGHDTPDATTPQVWEPGKSRTITLTFTALDSTAGTNNCAHVTSDSVGDPGVHPSTVDSCATVEIPAPLSAPTLTVNKVVINGFGGTATVGTFTLQIDGAPVTNGVANPESVGVHTVGEVANSGYSGTISGDCDPAGDVTLALGEDKVCTITNHDIQPQLIVVKHVINDNGGAALPSAFVMSVTGSSPSPSSFAGVDVLGTAVSLNAGVYSVSESGGPSWYAASSSADCSGTIAVGEVKTCTITNDDIPPHIIIDKVTIPAADPQVFNFNPSYGSPFGLADASPPNDSGPLTAGTYSVSEDAIGGWSQTSATCSNASPVSAIVVSVGETVTCTFTNTKLPTATPTNTATHTPTNTRRTRRR